MLPVLRQREPGWLSDAGGQDHLQLTDAWREFVRRRDGVCYALDGGVWFHRWRLRGHMMVHLVSADRERLLAIGAAIGFQPDWLQYKPLKDPRSGRRVAAWHWDVLGDQLKKVGL